MVASDRISAFDHILDTPIPDKGKVLTPMTLWWFEQLATGAEPRRCRPTYREVAGRAVVCERLDMFPVECVARGYLTGSGLLDYKATGEVCGIAVAAGARGGGRLPEPIFTPATKAELGEHDENVSYDAVVATVGAETAEALRGLTLAVYGGPRRSPASAGSSWPTRSSSSARRPDGTIVLADEVLTPDSSRFWPADQWEPGRAQPSYDKQIVRNWLSRRSPGGTARPASRRRRCPPGRRAHPQRYIEAYEQLTGLSF